MSDKKMLEAVIEYRKAADEAEKAWADINREFHAAISKAQTEAAMAVRESNLGKEYIAATNRLSEAKMALSKAKEEYKLNRVPPVKPGTVMVLWKYAKYVRNSTEERTWVPEVKGAGSIYGKPRQYPKGVFEIWGPGSDSPIRERAWEAHPTTGDMVVRLLKADGKPGKTWEWYYPEATYLRWYPAGVDPNNSVTES